MTGQIEDQISAFSDDELSPDECEFLVRRLERDEETRDKILRYSLIGAALRGELIAPDPDLLRDRIRQSLEGVSLVPRPTVDAPGWTTRLARPLLGAGIAASAAIVGLIALNQASQVSLVDTTPVIAQRQGPVANQGDDPPSYVVPQEAALTRSAPEALIQPPIRLTNYLVTHGEYAIGIGRTSIHSNVVSGQDNWQAADEAPAEE